MKALEKGDLLTIMEVAEVLSISYRTAYALVMEDKAIPSFHVGKRVRVHRDALTEWVTGEHPSRAQDGETND